jgi:hypothetical protein
MGQACGTSSKGKIKLSLCLTKHYAMKAYVGVDVYVHIFLTLVQVVETIIQITPSDKSANIDTHADISERAPFYRTIHMKRCM